jgi:hypothetical protein
VDYTFELEAVQRERERERQGEGERQRERFSIAAGNGNLIPRSIPIQYTVRAVGHKTPNDYGLMAQGRTGHQLH